MANSTSKVKPNEVYGSWTTIERSVRGNRSIWLCRCTCGDIKYVGHWNLVSGTSRSCWNCRFVTHGASQSPEYRTWTSMRHRCLYEHNKNYKNYGGRGIKICDRWLNSFENFREDMGERPPGTSLDRIDNEGGYDPSNCKWSTTAEQASNKRSNVRVEYEGQSYTLTQLALKLGIKKRTLSSRYEVGSKLDAPVMKRKLKGV